jgi:hypothetical protein
MTVNHMRLTSLQRVSWIAKLTKIASYKQLSNHTDAFYWIPFIVMLLWTWRAWDIFNTVPAYGDVLEVIWGVWWADHTLIQRQGDFLFNPLLFFPKGWHVGTFAHGLGLPLLLLPFAKIGGLAFAYNFASLASILATYVGMRRLSLCFLTSFGATLAALLFTFWGLRWLRIYGHLNILLAVTLLPWIILAIEHSFHVQRRKWLWLGIAGLLWGVAITFSLYFLWMVGIAVSVWIILRWMAQKITFQQGILSLLLVCFVAMVTSAPYTIIFAESLATSHSSFYSLEHIDSWGASLNSLPIPFVFNPWFGELSRRIHIGPMSEAGVANFGLIAFVFAGIGAYSALRMKQAWPFVAISAIGILLAMGLTLKLDTVSLQSDRMGTLNHLLWQLGHYFKPNLFPSADVPSSFSHSIPLPGMLLMAIVPYWEGVRVVSRFALLAGVGFFPLVAFGVQLQKKGLQWLLALLLLVEITPMPNTGVPFPPPSHQAFEWLAQQTLEDKGIIDLFSVAPGTLHLALRGETAWQTQLHKKPTMAGAGSIWPEHVVHLLGWLQQHPHSFKDPGFVPILRAENIRYILLHMQGPEESRLMLDVDQNEHLHLMQCFPPPAGVSPWPYDICVLDIH